METNKDNDTKSKSIFFSILIIVFIVWYYMGGGVEREVASNEIKQYEICIRNNDFIGASVHAGIVSAAFLKVRDEANYQKWKTLSDEALQNATNNEMNKY